MSDLSDVLEDEHRSIDRVIEEYLDRLTQGPPDPTPLRTGLELLRRHIYVEEEQIFPALRATGMTMPVFVMLKEHGEIWEAMDELERLLDQTHPAVPEVTVGCTRLLALLGGHNSKEEPIIYTAMGAALGAEGEVDAVTFLDGGTRPEGWVCQQLAQA